MSRKRQANVPGGRPVRREVKLTDAEDTALRFAAAELNITVPRYLKEAALASSRGETLTERKALLQHLFELQRQLAAVGNKVHKSIKIKTTSKLVVCTTPIRGFYRLNPYKGH